MRRHSYHGGEIEVQRRAGIQDGAARIGGSIHADIPEPAKRFLEQRRMVVLGAMDAHGRPWASILAGPRGFVSVPAPDTVRIASRPVSGDALARDIDTSGFAGMIAVDFSTRRRMRLNGRLSAGSDGALLIRADQVYANCRKYIQARSTEAAVEAGEVGTQSVVRSGGLTAAQRAWIRRADTFFIATANPGEGADASHRGGMPGFIRVTGDRLVWPDYKGNGMFNTLGNLTVHPWAGLTFPDFEVGSVLHVTGRAAIDWDPRRLGAAPGAERFVSVEVDECVQIERAFPVRLRLTEYSPSNPEPWRAASEGAERDAEADCDGLGR